MELLKDSVIKIVRNGEVKGVVIRDEKSRHHVFYELSECGQDEIISLLNTNEVQ